MLGKTAPRLGTAQGFVGVIQNSTVLNCILAVSVVFRVLILSSAQITSTRMQGSVSFLMSRIKHGYMDILVRTS
jgi:hypothetical protein